MRQDTPQEEKDLLTTVPQPEDPQNDSEKILLSAGQHADLEHKILTCRNLAVAAAVLLFLLSLLHMPGYNILKAVAYFFGAGAYFAEILLLTDVFTVKLAHREMFMVYCFAPLYLVLGISYIFH